MLKRKKIIFLLLCLIYMSSSAGWNESDYRPYSLQDFKNVRMSSGGTISELKNFPNVVILYKKKGLPLDIMVTNMFEYYQQGSVGFAVRTDLVEGDGVQGVRMDIISYSDIYINRRYTDRTYYSTTGDRKTVPITARYWINNEIDRSLEIPVYWEARRYSSSSMKTTNQKLIVRVPLQLKAFDLDFGQYFLGTASDVMRARTTVLIDGEVDSTVTLDIGEHNFSLKNNNGKELSAIAYLDGGKEKTVELGPSGEARVNIDATITSMVTEAGTYTGVVTVTAKYI